MSGTSSSQTGIPVTISNQLSVPLVVYNSVTTTPVATPPSSNASDYLPVYTQVATIPANGTTTFANPDILSRLVICEASNDFPVQVFIPPFLAASASTTVTESDLQDCQNLWTFYQQLFANPYSPESVQFNELFTGLTNISTLTASILTFFANNNLPGCTYAQFSIVSFWATNSLYGWDGTYYCYLPVTSSSGFIVPTNPCGIVTIANGLASYQSASGGAALALGYQNGQLTSTGASGSSGFFATAVPRTLTWESGSPQIVLCLVGYLDGAALTAQPYQNPALPWWIAAYNLAYGSFQVVQLAMTLDMAITVLEGVANGVAALSTRIGQFIGSVNDSLNAVSSSADSVAAEVGDAIEPINVDVDVDVDVDIDVDTDTDNVEDTDTVTDTDVDVDVDVDIDDDVFAVIDVDVDVDVDTDVVTDTDNVTDIDTVTDVDTDTDIDTDTDVNVEPGAVNSLTAQIGSWIMTKGFSALVENLVIMITMITAQKLLNTWRSSDEQDLQNMQPAQSTGLGLLINYMLNESNSVQTRWTTFADFVQQSKPSTSTQQMLLTSILMTQNTVADTASQDWKWPSSNQNDIVLFMSQYKTASNEYQAYAYLATVSYNGKPLPVKVGCQVALSYLSAPTSNLILDQHKGGIFEG